MVLVSANVALILFGIILILSALIAWYMKGYNNYDKCSFHTFIAILTGLGVFVTFMFYYNVVELQNQQQELAALQELSRINDFLINSILKNLKEASTVAPNFVLSLTPLSNTICCFTASTGNTGSCDITVDPDPVDAQTCTVKMTLSYRIFSIWQDLVVSSKYVIFDPNAYIYNFLQWANSDQLYLQWNISKPGLTPKAQIFGDLLFEYALPIQVQTTESYQNATTKLLNDPRYKDLHID